MGNYCCIINKDVNPSGSNIQNRRNHVEPEEKEIRNEVPGQMLHSSSPASNFKTFSFEELIAATRNFRPDNILGKNGSGYLTYKGWIDEILFTATKPGTGICIAVKKLQQVSFHDHKKLLAKLNYLGGLHHPNLVQLIGYCLEDGHWCLVYEFISHGSLDQHLFGTISHGSLDQHLFGTRGNSSFQPFSWNLRMKVALGVAKGLAFLHSAETQILYGKFKICDILLDSNYNAKLSDFGLVEDANSDNDMRRPDSPRYIVTRPDIAPESYLTGEFTAKSDVYWFGVVLLQVLSGRRAIDTNRPSGEHNLVEWAKPYLNKKHKISRVIDTRLEGQYKPGAAQKAAMLTLQCLSLDPKHRPSMDEVVVALEQLQDSN